LGFHNHPAPPICFYFGMNRLPRQAFFPFAAANWKTRSANPTVSRLQQQLPILNINDFRGFLAASGFNGFGE